MGKDSAIEWTDATWNPWMGCTKVSPGCKNCYMFRDQKHYGHDPTIIRKTKTTMRDPLKWKEPRMIFVCSWSDFFHEDVDPEWRREAWEIMGHAKEHTFLILTKRPENMIDMMPVGWVEGQWHYFRHIWLGVSTENQKYADERIPKLLEIPAQVHFVSAEPLLGSINLREFLWTPTGKFRTHEGERQYQMKASEKIGWVITGGESDLRNPRDMDLNWAVGIRDQCAEAGVPFFHKQHGGTRKINGAWGGRMIDGVTYDQIPERIIND